MALTEPFFLPPGDIPTEPLPLLERTSVLVHPELRPGIPIEPGISDYYRASLSGTAASGQPATGPAAGGQPADGCCD